MMPWGRGRVCDDCWALREGSRVPTRIVDAEEERCVFCGTMTRSGITQRVHTEDVLHPAAVKL